MAIIQGAKDFYHFSTYHIYISSWNKSNTDVTKLQSSWRRLALYRQIKGGVYTSVHKLSSRLHARCQNPHPSRKKSHFIHTSTYTTLTAAATRFDLALDFAIYIYNTQRNQQLSIMWVHFEATKKLSFFQGIIDVMSLSIHFPYFHFIRQKAHIIVYTKNNQLTSVDVRVCAPQEWRCGRVNLITRRATWQIVP